MLLYSYLVVQILPVEARPEYGAILDVENLLHVLHDGVGRGGRESEDRNSRELTSQHAQKLVVCNGVPNTRTTHVFTVR